MALVIVSAGALARSRMRTLTTRTLVAVACALALAGLLGGLALGLKLGGSGHENVGGVPEFANLDREQPENEALIREIGSLSGRLIRLESASKRLTTRLGLTAPVTEEAAADPVSEDATTPAGGPLLEPDSHAGPRARAFLPGLHRGLDHVEANLERVAAIVARQDIHQMAYPSRSPIPGVSSSSGFGRRIDPFTRRAALHNGMDFNAPWGTPILASAGGRVRRAGSYGAYGRTVEIDHGDGLVTRYGHASRVLVRVGDMSLPGQPIATVGSSGRSTGPHLHFEILRDGTQVPPDLYLESGAH